MSDRFLWCFFGSTLLLIFYKWFILLATTIISGGANFTTHATRVQWVLIWHFKSRFVFCSRWWRVLCFCVLLKCCGGMLHLRKRMHLSPMNLIRVSCNLHSLILSAACWCGETVLGSDGRIFGRYWWRHPWRLRNRRKCPFLPILSLKINRIADIFSIILTLILVVTVTYVWRVLNRIPHPIRLGTHTLGCVGCNPRQHRSLVPITISKPLLQYN